MLSNIMIGRYFPGDSVLHRLDARVKLILLLTLMIGVFFCADAISYGSVTLLTAGLVLLSGVPVKTVMRSVEPLWWILLFTFAVHLFGTEGEEALGSVGSFTATKEGLVGGVFMCLRLVLLILLSSLLTFTTDPLALTDAMERLLSPFKRFNLPAHELAMMMTIALRFVPTLIEETDKIIKAQSSRGADFENGSLVSRTKNFVPILVPLFIACFRRADELALAMEARCYPSHGEGRTQIKKMRVTALDYAAIGITTAIVLGLVGLRFY